VPPAEATAVAVPPLVAPPVAAPPVLVPLLCDDVPPNAAPPVAEAGPTLAPPVAFEPPVPSVLPEAALSPPPHAVSAMPKAPRTVTIRVCLIAIVS
jgi:hypothetical protein